MKAVFLDRDGVINEYPGDYKYVTVVSEFKFLPRVKAALKKLNRPGIFTFVISNQAGVAKGIFTRQSLDEITRHMLSGLKQAGARISGVYYCTHREEDRCCCRKPKTGLIESALKNLKEKKPAAKQPLKCFFVGDTVRDIQTGKAAGCTTILVFSGKERPENKKDWTFQPDFTAKDLSEAVEIILRS